MSEAAIGLDFGTTNSAIAWVVDDEVWEVFAFWTLEVVFDDDGEVLGFDVREEDDTLSAEIRRAEADAGF